MLGAAHQSKIRLTKEQRNWEFEMSYRIAKDNKCIVKCKY